MKAVVGAWWERGATGTREKRIHRIRGQQNFADFSSNILQVANMRTYEGEILFRRLGYYFENEGNRNFCQFRVRFTILNSDGNSLVRFRFLKAPENKLMQIQEGKI